MHLSRRRFLAATAIVLAAGPLAAAAPSALSFLASIYDSYGPGKYGIPLDDEAALRRWFSPSLADLIQKDRAAAAEVDEVPMLDGDPFIDAQDGDITDLSLKVDDLGDGKAIGHVAFRNSGDPRSIELKLVETSAGWRIDEINWGDATLRGLYTH
ncbi:hypothetical protein C3941_18655 [Kaistia algarum]|uniref:DUF3828 domain-containing protein n=1 Tax=Kaistia algarum TaxID=2083279 RepID=UPI000CE91531|nr:DUF3828 domain-containing protein [Kaistia algarum]MCX5516535.1 DUF3828 domain-containing protein [Kaistia algarum]PPE78352.1 hypothetical protein C3941_18655 [Kaistia algarum]